MPQLSFCAPPETSAQLLLWFEQAGLHAALQLSMPAVGRAVRACACVETWSALHQASLNLTCSPAVLWRSLKPWLPMRDDSMQGLNCPAAI